MKYLLRYYGVAYSIETYYEDGPQNVVSVYLPYDRLWADNTVASIYNSYRAARPILVITGDLDGTFTPMW
jgi:hypothetical protein